MKQYLKKISANNSLDYYTNGSNFGDTDLVTATIEYFETGPGSRAFKPLEFLNLLWRQYNFIIENIEDTEKLISTLINLPLSDLEKHILFGFILKWFGGYPLEAPSGFVNSELHYNFRKRLLHKFLAYDTDTPEKLFCKADFEKRERAMKAAIAVETSINYGIDAYDVFQAMPETTPNDKSYSDFNELFEDAALHGAFGRFKNRQVHLIQQSSYNFKFNVWLQKTKDWEYGNTKQYSELLTRDNFMQFLRDEKLKEEQERRNFREQESRWQIVPPSDNITDEIIKPIIERHQLTDFLSVPAPDVVIKDAFWHDENGNPIDNISGKDYIDNGGKIVKVDYVLTHQTRLAEDERDFEIIYQREFASKNLSNHQEARKIFREELANYVQGLMTLHKNRSTYNNGLDIDLLALAQRFLYYLQNKEENTNQNEPEQNDLSLSTIEEFLSPFKTNMTETDFNALVMAKKQYFEQGTFPKLKGLLKVRGKINKKKFGWVLNELYRRERPNTILSVEYLKFGKQYLSIFKEVPFEDMDYTKSTLYKYYTTKPK